MIKRKTFDLGVDGMRNIISDIDSDIDDKVVYYKDDISEFYITYNDNKDIKTMHYIFTDQSDAYDVYRYTIFNKLVAIISFTKKEYDDYCNFHGIEINYDDMDDNVIDAIGDTSTLMYQHNLDRNPYAIRSSDGTISYLGSIR